MAKSRSCYVTLASRLIAAEPFNSGDYEIPGGDLTNMKRKLLSDLETWKNQSKRKPLVLRGPRQVGKTWLMKEFGRLHYPQCAYINFENNQRMKSLFEGNFDIKRIVAGLTIESGVAIDAATTLILFDEVQEVPKALTALKYFSELAEEYHIVAAGSLLGVAIHPATSFPVGKVEFMDLHPLDFTEFLSAAGQKALLDPLSARDFELVKVFKDRYIEFLKLYLFIGGMPEAVATYLETSNLIKVREVHANLLKSYEQDFSKHAPSTVVPRIRMLWNSIPSQLAKENRKFIYGLIRDGARAREYELALMWLYDCGLVTKVNRISKPAVPLGPYQDLHAFKLYVHDVGLLGALSQIDAKSIIDGNKIFTEFKGALTEQFVVQQLVSNKNISPCYWSAENSRGEVDIVFQWGQCVVPLEVKSAENLQAKSLRSFFQQFKPKWALRTSLSDFRSESWLINIPLYAINYLPSILDDMSSDDGAVME